MRYDEIDKKFLLKHGNAKDILKDFPEKIFQTVVTSPPYWSLRDYFAEGQLGQEETFEEYVEDLVSILEEVKRVLRDDGTLWLNIGDSYNNNAGWSRSKGDWKRKGREHGSADKKEVKNSVVKRKELFGIPWRVAFALQESGWYLRSDIVWCLSGGTEVYVKTENREFPTSIKDLYRLNIKKCKLWNGEKWTNIVGITKQKQKHNEIQFVLRSGERFCCTPEHRWPTERGVLKTSDLIIGDIIKNCRLPEPDDKFQSDYLPDEDIGWFVGIYLSEGSRSGKTIQISSHQKEIVRYERLKKIAEQYHGSCHEHITSENGKTINIESDILNSIIDIYIGGKIAKNKYLKYRCWQRSNKFLKNILLGYLEGDGSYDNKNNRYRIGFTRNYYLEKSLRTLCARIGVFCKINLSTSKIKDKVYKTFKGEIKFKKNGHWNDKNLNEIIDIQKDKGGREYFYDIEVKDEPHIFALSSGVLTHNSKENPMPDGAKDRPTHSHEYIFLLTKKPNYYYDYYAILEDSKNIPDKLMSFGAKNQKGTFRCDQDRVFEHYGKKNKRSVWKNPVSSFKGDHFATFPIELINPCILAGTSSKGCCAECGKPIERQIKKVKVKSEKGKGYDLRLVSDGWDKKCKCKTNETRPCLVLDPFSGMATTGIASLMNFRDYVGIDINSDYIDKSRKRINKQSDGITEIYDINDFF